MPAGPGTLTAAHWSADKSEPVLDTTVGGVLREAAERAGAQEALVEGVDGARRRWTYEELLVDAERVARALLARFEPGERVAIWAPNGPEWVLVELGAALAGLTLVTVNPAYKPKELAYVLGQSRAAGAFFLPEYRGLRMGEALESVRGELPELRDAFALTDFHTFLAGGVPGERLPDVDPSGPAQIEYTSGTTGFPKGALLTHRGITNNARFCAQRLEVAPGATWVNPMPLFHGGGSILATLGAIQARARHVCVHVFDPDLVLGLVEAERADVLGGVPTMFIACMEARAAHDTSSLRAVVSGGSTVPIELVRSMEAELGVRFGIVFGQTEASIVITQTRLDDSPVDKAETIGRALPQAEVRVVRPGTDEVADVGELGELLTRGYLVMDGYFEMPDRTAEAIDSGGWLHTGDLGTMDERGYCRVEGRLKDMIIRGGENIYPREIEELLFAHPGVADVAVVGFPDERWGEQVAAFVRPAAGDGAAPPTEAELSEYVRSRLAAYKAPRRWVFVDELPLTPSGKVQKYVLRERLAG